MPIVYGDGSNNTYKPINTVLDQQRVNPNNALGKPLPNLQIPSKPTVTSQQQQILETQQRAVADRLTRNQNLRTLQQIANKGGVYAQSAASEMARQGFTPKVPQTSVPKPSFVPPAIVAGGGAVTTATASNPLTLPAIVAGAVTGVTIATAIDANRQEARNRSEAARLDELLRQRENAARQSQAANPSNTRGTSSGGGDPPPYPAGTYRVYFEAEVIYSENFNIPEGSKQLKVARFEGGQTTEAGPLIFSDTFEAGNTWYFRYQSFAGYPSDPSIKIGTTDFVDALSFAPVRYKKPYLKTVEKLGEDFNWAAVPVPTSSPNNGTWSPPSGYNPSPSENSNFSPAANSANSSPNSAANSRGASNTAPSSPSPSSNPTPTAPPPYTKPNTSASSSSGNPAYASPASVIQARVIQASASPAYASPAYASPAYASPAFESKPFVSGVSDPNTYGKEIDNNTGLERTKIDTTPPPNTRPSTNQNDLTRPLAPPPPAPAPAPAPNTPPQPNNQTGQILAAIAGLTATVIGGNALINYIRGLNEQINAQTTAAEQKNNVKAGVCEVAAPNQCLDTAIKRNTDPINQQATANNGLLNAILALLQGLNTFLLSNIGKILDMLNRQVIDRFLALTNFAMTLHNALMLSQGIGDTVGAIVDNILNLTNLSFKNSEGATVGTGEVINANFRQFMINLVGENNYTTLSETFAKANRIYQAGMNLVNNVQSMLDSAASVAQSTGINVAKIGNALRDNHVVSPREYGHMDDSPEGNRATKKDRFQQLTTLISDADSNLQNFASITGSVVSIKDSVKQSKDDIKAFNDARSDNSQANQEAKEAIQQQIKDLKPLTEITIAKREEDS